MPKTKREKIYDLFKSRSCTKQDVFDESQKVFDEIKVVLQEIAEQYSNHVCTLDERVKIEYSSSSPYRAQIQFGGDLLVFQMHTNVFSFDKEHHIWKTSYVKEDEMRAYCGMINVYNFLADSFKFNRLNDAGYLVTRLFVNKERHFFAEGKKELNYLFNNFVEGKLDRETMVDIIESSILYAIRFELQSPPFANMERISVNQMNQLSQNNDLGTDKQLGFKLQGGLDID